MCDVVFLLPASWRFGLEYLDRAGVTQRIGDLRQLREQLEFSAFNN
jgi:hypothetical protein